MLDCIALDRFFHHVRLDLTSGCWLWTGGLTGGGYGQWMIGGRRTKAHRWAYELMVGPIPEGLVVDHTCHNADESCPDGDRCLHRRCVNPDHLEAVTTWENTMRSDLTPGSRNAAKTHCPEGHPYDVVEDVGGGKRGRRCAACRRLRERKRQAASRTP